MKKTNEKRFAHKGDSVIQVNNRIVEEAVKNISKVEIDKNWIDLTYQEKDELSFDETIDLLKGNELPVSAFFDKRSGVFPGGSTKKEKR